jgi:hypothetical protein
LHSLKLNGKRIKDGEHSTSAHAFTELNEGYADMPMHMHTHTDIDFSSNKITAEIVTDNR